MKNQSLILLVVAAGCGLVAMIGVRKAINQKPHDAEETIQVLSAVADIQVGQRLDELNTKFVEVRISTAPEGAVTSMDEVAERSLKVPVMPGDWILKSKLTEVGEMGAVASIPKGMAVVTIPVDATTSHSGMMRPGNRVDLLLTYDDNSQGRSVKKMITVMEFVEVFAVDNRIYGIDKEGDGLAKNISLLVEPEQGKVVNLAKRLGELSTMLRAHDDTTASGKTEISAEFLDSSFSGTGHRNRSVMENRGYENLALKKNDEADSSMDSLLNNELSRQPGPGPEPSAPIKVAKLNDHDIWTMEIYEGDQVRIESIQVPLPAESPATQGWNMWDLLKTKNTN
ncbi:MAG TPA: Flp pilus assembly protein CpaB [Planctomycetaceae bacterium]|nr:Flp pilus assembly protein CpaB [Planctomycetaceae bacterium]HRA86528.1 Flp pilus assembly protein CpaB [Planctomycetaceae bacterium]